MHTCHCIVCLMYVGVVTLRLYFGFEEIIIQRHRGLWIFQHDSTSSLSWRQCFYVLLIGFIFSQCISLICIVSRIRKTIRYHPTRWVDVPTLYVIPSILFEWDNRKIHFYCSTLFQLLRFCQIWRNCRLNKILHQSWL